MEGRHFAGGINGRLDLGFVEPGLAELDEVPVPRLALQLLELDRNFVREATLHSGKAGANMTPRAPKTMKAVLQGGSIDFDGLLRRPAAWH